MPTTLQELKSNPELRIGHHESLLVMVWRGKVTPQSIDAAVKAEAELVERFPRISVMTVIGERTSATPGAELAQSAAGASWRFGENVRGAAVVLPTDQGTATPNQVALRGLLSLSSHHRVFASVEPAMEWFGKLPGEGATALPQHAADAVKRFVTESLAS